MYGILYTETRKGERTMNRANTNRLRCAKSSLEDCIYNGNLSKWKFTLCELQTAIDVLMRVRQENTAECIMENVKNFYVAHNFTVKTHGIGWTISL